MIKRLLIANRGEIACRIMRTCRKMGIETVAVYSSADRMAKHVREADQSVFIGAAASSESYLNISRIIEAAQETGADAIHPGYGFLSENPAFADACVDAEIVFIGPSGTAMQQMASKADAKALMAMANVPLIPGYYGDNQEPSFLHSEADAMGYPLLIKAVAGGGGKGMRAVQSSDQFLSALESCVTEAKNSFGDTKVLLERLITNARHVEVQIIADSHGHCLYIGDRDCSVQRRHQKVIEEAPAPNLSDKLRKEMGETSAKAALSIGYENAGTFEYLVSGDQFYFMEMNTRLQVEHPVSEAVFGVDLVEWQLMVAAGLPLPVEQSQLEAKGHAVEARIYAESPIDNFMPSAGHIKQWQWPVNASVRLESAVDQGDWVTPYYDPMVAKVITYGSDRDDALSTLNHVLDQSCVSGITTNRAFIKQVSNSSTFKNAAMTTEWLESWLENTDLESDLNAAEQHIDDRNGPFVSDAFKINLPNHQNQASADMFASIVDNDTSGEYKAPMNGRVLEVLVCEGEKVVQDQLLAVMEAMKMEHRITATAPGQITSVLTSADAMVTGGELMIEVNHG